MPDSPLVSVILPVFNREHLVSKAIDSVLAQTYRPWELIVVDDGSTDRTPEVLRAYGNKIILLQQPNRGPYAARNLALSRVQGDLVAFLDSDDTWYPQKLALQVPLFDQPDVGLVFGDAIFIDNRYGRKRRCPLTYFSMWPPPRRQVLETLVRRNFIPQSSAVARRTCLEAVGPFSLAGPLASDYAQWVKLAMHYDVVYVNDPVFEFWIHQSNTSRDSTVSYRSQIKLFEELLTQTPFDKLQRLFYRKLFDLHVNLIRASVFRGWKSLHQAISLPVKTDDHVRLLDKVRWLFVSIGDQLSLGVKVLIQRML